MALSDVWTESDPTGSTYANTLAVVITQAVKRALRERLAIDHYFYADETGYSNVGYHKQVTLPVLAADPTVVASTGILFTKEVGGKAELHFIDEDGNTLQITSAGAILVNSVVSGLIVMWHGTIANIPTGYVICDGNNSTPNLLAKMVRGVATAATNPGDTGGADTHVHTGPSHTHTVSGSTAANTDIGAADAGSASSHTKPADAHLHGAGTLAADAAGTGNTGSGSTLPAYYAVAFIMKT
uniref:Putative tail collar domain protein n=1 Tax=viral metagenome TaxID=1070528 RepID=A0A6H1ZXM1_9ZZZZ